jgi:hypothetical protein
MGLTEYEHLSSVHSWDGVWNKFRSTRQKFPVPSIGDSDGSPLVNQLLNVMNLGACIFESKARCWSLFRARSECIKRMTRITIEFFSLTQFTSHRREHSSIFNRSAWPNPEESVSRFFSAFSVTTTDWFLNQDLFSISSMKVTFAVECQARSEFNSSWCTPSQGFPTRLSDSHLKSAAFPTYIQQCDDLDEGTTMICDLIDRVDIQFAKARYLDHFISGNLKPDRALCKFASSSRILSISSSRDLTRGGSRDPLSWHGQKPPKLNRKYLAESSFCLKHRMVVSLSGYLKRKFY